MPVIALVGNKGGAGKTTLCINLASALAERGATVVLDADPQQSSHNWHAIADGRSAFPVISASDDVVQLAADHVSSARYVLIDCPPSVRAQQTSDADLWRTANQHCLTTRKYLIRGDGSGSHEGIFDLESGEFLQQSTQQGWRNNCGKVSAELNHLRTFLFPCRGANTASLKGCCPPGPPSWSLVRPAFSWRPPATPISIWRSMNCGACVRCTS